MVVGSEDGREGIDNPAISRKSKGESTSEGKKASLPPVPERSRKGKLYVPAFLKPGAKATHRHDTKNDDVDAHDPVKVTKQGKAAVPAFLEPGWGEAPRKPPMIGKNKSAAMSMTAMGRYYDKVNVGEWPSEASTSGKAKGTRRSWSRPWEKHSQITESAIELAATGEIGTRKDEGRGLTAVTLAQSGPASIVQGSVFPSDVVTPYQAGTFVGDAQVSVEDLPSMLRLGHTSNKTEGQHEGSTPTYKWPFVDMRNELFLNYDPKKDNGATGRTRGLKYQEPRIVDMELPTNGLEAEVLQGLAKRELRNRAFQAGVNSPDGLEVSPGPDSPVSPLIDVAKEVTIVGTDPTRFKAREVNIGARNKSLRTPEAPAAVISEATKDQQAKSSDQPDFSWFRFSRVDLEDPADQHCRDYRARRREVRKSKQDTWSVHAR